MNLRAILFAIAAGCIAGVEFAIYGTAYSLASIPLGGLYKDDISQPGRIYENHPATHIRSLAAETLTDIEFGLLLKTGTNPVEQCAVFDSAAADIAGVSVWSTDASDIDNNRYLDGDPVGVLDEGIITGYVEEAVTPASPVRVRIAMPGTPAPENKLGAFLTTAAVGQTAVLSGFEFRGSTNGPGVVPIAVSKAAFGAIAD